jgi:hypothetical protein
MSSCWQHFGEVRELLQGSTSDRWQRVAVLMDAHGGKDDAAARAYVRAVIERLPIHERPCRLVVSSAKGGSLGALKDAFKSMPEGMAFRRVKRFNRYALAPLYGRVGRGDNTGAIDIYPPLWNAWEHGVAALLEQAAVMDVSDLDAEAIERRVVVLGVIRADHAALCAQPTK